jgi:hypothetical protein
MPPLKRNYITDEERAASHAAGSCPELEECSNDIDQIKAALTSDKTLDGTEQVLDFDTASEACGISMPANGVFEVSKAGYYTGKLNLYISENGNPVIFAWMEKRVTESDPWELASPQMIEFQAITSTGSFIPMDSNLNLDAGNQIRIMIKKTSDSATLTSSVRTVTAGTITQYPASVSIYRVGNKLGV